MNSGTIKVTTLTVVDSSPSSEGNPVTSVHANKPAAIRALLERWDDESTELAQLAANATCGYVGAMADLIEYVEARLVDKVEIQDHTLRLDVTVR